ncbi:hypothetical protein LTR56_001645 [Elasticomyces elasticus]|nr:hypothetical protein LTR56_001645 [Elasticomyces elasticus]KAK3667303.1 hypothetical protein LTR22_001819 [Elasticomyces elasticus]KAK4932617.1 hypothetical protein LTR49_001041 [Elasticomyces elasticus]KAK5769639.1 hypothetical protein LTS12_000089 [Elasticomyces elasticus]
MGNRHSTASASAPPPYSSLPTDDAQGLQQDQMQEFVALTSGILDRERSGGTSDCLRLQNFLRFVLLVDYNTSDEKLTPADYNHYTKLYVLIKDMSEYSRVFPRDPKEVVSTQYIYKNLYQPARQLGVPYHIVLKMVYRFGTSKNRRGQYKGCTPSVLHRFGLHEFVTKLLVDSKIMVPLLFDKGDLRAALEEDIYIEFRVMEEIHDVSLWEKLQPVLKKC